MGRFGAIPPLSLYRAEERAIPSFDVPKVWLSVSKDGHEIDIHQGWELAGGRLEVERLALLSSCTELDLTRQSDRARSVDGVQRVETSA
jgi:hypothetical protein